MLLGLNRPVQSLPVTLQPITHILFSGEIPRQVPALCLNPELSALSADV